MTELWMAIGMAICDCEFNEELQAVADPRIVGKTEALKLLLPIMQKYGFRMSLYEIVEFLRIIRTNVTTEAKTQNVLPLMLIIHNGSWFLKDQPPECLNHFMLNALTPIDGGTDVEANPKYLHPSVVIDRSNGNHVLASVNPMTNEPIDQGKFSRSSNNTVSIT